jgi:hypothetical protein
VKSTAMRPIGCVLSGNLRWPQLTAGVPTRGTFHGALSSISVAAGNFSADVPN